MPDYLDPPDLPTGRTESGQQQKEEQPEFFPFASTNIASAQYDPKQGVLQVTFLRGDTYAYGGVSKEEWAEMKRSPSVGRFFHAVIKDKASERVD